MYPKRETKTWANRCIRCISGEYVTRYRICKRKGGNFLRYTEKKKKKGGAKEDKMEVIEYVVSYHAKQDQPSKQTNKRMMMMMMMKNDKNFPKRMLHVRVHV